MLRHTFLSQKLMICHSRSNKYGLQKAGEMVWAYVFFTILDTCMAMVICILKRGFFLALNWLNIYYICTYVLFYLCRPPGICWLISKMKVVITHYSNPEKEMVVISQWSKIDTVLTSRNTA